MFTFSGLATSLAVRLVCYELKMEMQFDKIN